MDRITPSVSTIRIRSACYQDVPVLICHHGSVKTDILNTTQNPDELRRLAQAHGYEKRLQSLNAAMQAEKSTPEQPIRGQEAMMLAEKAAPEQRIREPEEALKLAQPWRFGRKSERLPASQKPLADEDAASDEADITCQLSDLLPPEEKKWEEAGASAAAGTSATGRDGTGS